MVGGGLPPMAMGQSPGILTETPLSGASRIVAPPLPHWTASRLGVEEGCHQLVDPLRRLQLHHMPLPRQDFHLSLKPLGMSGRDDCVVAAPDHQAWLLPDNIAQIQALPPALEQRS